MCNLICVVLKVYLPLTRDCSHIGVLTLSPKHDAVVSLAVHVQHTPLEAA
jgi:uncharacterized membrane protein YccF (DUF307 family)